MTTIYLGESPYVYYLPPNTYVIRKPWSQLPTLAGLFTQAPPVYQLLRQRQTIVGRFYGFVMGIADAPPGGAFIPRLTLLGVG